MKSLKMGDPMKEDTDVGPMSRKDLRDNTHEYVLKAFGDGAKLLCGKSHKIYLILPRKILHFNRELTRL